MVANAKNVDFTLWLDYTATDLEDLGEAGLVNDALGVLFNETNYESNGREFAIKRVSNLETKVVPVNNRVRVMLFGKVDLGKELVAA